MRIPVKLYYINYGLLIVLLLLDGPPAAGQPGAAVPHPVGRPALRAVRAAAAAPGRPGPVLRLPPQACRAAHAAPPSLQSLLSPRPPPTRV